MFHIPRYLANSPAIDAGPRAALLEIGFMKDAAFPFICGADEVELNGFAGAVSPLTGAQNSIDLTVARVRLFSWKKTVSHHNTFRLNSARKA
jgi:hypothetical protein